MRLQSGAEGLGDSWRDAGIQSKLKPEEVGSTINEGIPQQ